LVAYLLFSDDTDFNALSQRSIKALVLKFVQPTNL